MGVKVARSKKKQKKLVKGKERAQPVIIDQE